MVTLNDLKNLSNIHNIPKEIHINENIVLDSFLEANLSESPKTVEYDFDVYLNDYGINLQRPYVWNATQQQEFILSLLLDKPLPPIVVVDIDIEESFSRDIQTKRLVIDGKQRLLTIKRFINNELMITINGKQCLFSSFDNDLRSLFIRQIKFLTATVYYASENKNRNYYMSDDMKITLFNFYNFAGTPQEKSHKDKLQELITKK